MLSRGRVYLRGRRPGHPAHYLRASAPSNSCVHFCARPCLRTGSASPGPNASATDSSSDATHRSTLDTLEHVRDVETGNARLPRAPSPTHRQSPRPTTLTEGSTSTSATSPGRASTATAPPTAPSRTTSTAATGYCVLDNDYAKSQYGDRTDQRPCRSRPPTSSSTRSSSPTTSTRTSGSWRAPRPGWRTRSTTPSTTTTSSSPTSPIRHPRTSTGLQRRPYPYGSFLFFKYAAERLGMPPDRAALLGVRRRLE